MPNDTVPAAVPGLPKPASDDLGGILFDMEYRVDNLVRWARVIQDLGTADGGVAADGLFAIGNAMLADAKSVRDDWERCRELTRDSREGD